MATWNANHLSRSAQTRQITVLDGKELVKAASSPMTGALLSLGETWDTQVLHMYPGSSGQSRAHPTEAVYVRR